MSTEEKARTPYLLAVALLVLLVPITAVVCLNRLRHDRAAVPLSSGASWTFAYHDDPTHHVILRVGNTTTFEDSAVQEIDLVDLSHDTTQPLGAAYLQRAWLGLDLVGTDGSMGHHLTRARLLPFPFGPSSRWRSSVGKSWMESQYTVHFQIDGYENVEVAAGKFQALPVHFGLGLRGMAPTIVRGTWWLARGTGPVRFELDDPRGSFGLSAMSLELESYTR